MKRKIFNYAVVDSRDFWVFKKFATVSGAKNLIKRLNQRYGDGKYFFTDLSLAK